MPTYSVLRRHPLLFQMSVGGESTDEELATYPSSTTMFRITDSKVSINISKLQITIVTHELSYIRFWITFGYFQYLYDV